MTSRTSIARLVRRATPDFVTRALGRAYGVLDEYSVVAYAQEGEDLLLRRMFDDQQRGFYVDVGAHHPFRFSNTCIFHRRGWRGINVDPDPNAMELFRRLRPLDVNLCIGISDVAGTLRYHAFNEPALNTFDAELAREREGISGYRLASTFDVPVRRLDDVLSEYLPRGQIIDFLTVDAEGLDLNVLRSNDWERFRPACVLAEALDCTLSKVPDNPVFRHLTGAGYELYAKTVNTLVFRDSRNDRWR